MNRKSYILFFVFSVVVKFLIAQDHTVDDDNDTNFFEDTLFNKASDITEIHKSNRIIAWRYVNDYLEYSTFNFNKSIKMSQRSIDYFRSLFSDNAIVYNDLSETEGNYIEIADYIDNLSEYSIGKGIDVSYQEKYIIYNNLFTKNIHDLKPVLDPSDKNKQSYFYQVKIKKYVAAVFTNENRYLYLDEPRELDLLLKIHVFNSRNYAEITGIYVENSSY